jgi:hypothetical protein
VRAVVLALAGLVALLAFVPSAMAARDPINSGITDFHMKRGFEKKLNNLGVQVSGLGATTVSGRKIGMLIRDGKPDPTDVQGFVNNRGGFKLGLGKRGVPITEVTVNTVKRAVYAKIAKARMQLASISAFTNEREGFGANLKAPKVFLTEKAVRRISNRLGLEGAKRLNTGRVLSNLYVAAQPETVTLLPSGSAVLDGNLGTLKKFGEKGVKLPEGISAIAPASKPTPTSFQFPISGGTLAPDASAGTVETSGGVQIAKEGGATMKLLGIHADFTAKTATVEIEIVPAPPFPGAVGRSSIADLVLTGATILADPATRQISVQNADAQLQAVAAATLNDVFNQPAPEPPPSSNFVVGDSFGKFSFTAQGQ